jgi:hypothetical protein
MQAIAQASGIIQVSRKLSYSRNVQGLHLRAAWTSQDDNPERNKGLKQTFDYADLDSHVSESAAGIGEPQPEQESAYAEFAARQKG